MRVDINFNDYICVKLTDEGREIYVKKLSETVLLDRTDKAGYTKMQHWVLIQMFGEHIWMGKMKMPFKMNAYVETD